MARAAADDDQAAGARAREHAGEALAEGVDTAIELHAQRVGEPLRVVALQPVEGQ